MRRTHLLKFTCESRMGGMYMHDRRVLTAIILTLSLLLVLPGCSPEPIPQEEPIPQDQLDFFHALSDTQYWTATAMNVHLVDSNNEERGYLGTAGAVNEGYISFQDFSVTRGTSDQPIVAHIAAKVSDGIGGGIAISIQVNAANMAALQGALLKMESNEHRTQRLEAARLKEETPSTTVPPSKPPTHTTTIAPTDYKGWLRRTVEREIGAESNLKVSRVRDITFETADESEPVLDIVADDNLSHGFIRTGMLLDAKKVFRAVFADNRASKLTVGMFFPMIDAYGNSETTILMDIQMSRETAEKINWDNFLTDNLPLVADYFYERPGW